MPGHDTDSDWKEFGRTDPYWAVLTDDRFKGENLTADNLALFFDSGRQYMDWVFRTLREKLAPDFTATRGLDFGCGVGRLTLAMAKHVEEAVGVDVAPAMLEKARRHAAEQGIANAAFVQGDDALSNVTGTFDFLNSFIVFQHIPYERGLEYVRQMVGRLNPAGGGALHLLIGKQAYDAAPTRHFPTPQVRNINGSEHFKKAVALATAKVKGKLFGRAEPEEPAPVAPEPTGPVMQMNAYPLNPFLRILQQAGVRETYSVFTDHGGEYGAIVFFHKAPAWADAGRANLFW